MKTERERARARRRTGPDTATKREDNSKRENGLGTAGDGNEGFHQEMYLVLDRATKTQNREGQVSRNTSHRAKNGDSRGRRDGTAVVGDWDGDGKVPFAPCACTISKVWIKVSACKMCFADTWERHQAAAGKKRPQRRGKRVLLTTHDSLGEGDTVTEKLSEVAK